MPKTEKIQVNIFPLPGAKLKGEYKIADHVNLSGEAPGQIGFIPLTDLYTHKNDPDAIKVLCLKEGLVPDEEEAKLLLKEGIVAYTYELHEAALYTAAASKQLDARGVVASIPEDFKLLGLKLGIKESGAKDLGIIFSEKEASWAGVFTQNKARAICVDHNINLLGKKIKAIACNSGNANANTGEHGVKTDKAMREIIAKKLNIKADEVLIASTGKVGVPLEIKDLLEAADFRQLSNSEQSIKDYAQAILTTDTKIKIRQSPNILGFAKGSGMIEPNMATMLAFCIGDIKVKGDLQKILREVADESFNCISVDGDTSTNDMLLFMTTETGAELSEAQFKAELLELCQDLAKKIVLDGEGNTKLIELKISNCENKDFAKIIGKKIINSLLVKSAIFGNDPNWGRINVALGNALVDAEQRFSELAQKLDLERVSLSIQKQKVFEHGLPTSYITAEKTRDELSLNMKKSRTISIDLDLALEPEELSLWGSDLSYEYVRINAEYFT